MYSPRRYYSHPKSRQYYRKKKINQKFSPAAYKNNIPTFYQQKGRILQTSPLKLYQVPRQIPNSKTLEKMYNLLLKVKYPGVGPDIILPIDPNLEINYAVHNIPIMDLFSFTDESTATSIQIGKEYCNFIISALPTLPPPSQGYKWGAALMTILYDYDLGSVPNTSQFHLDYVNNWLSDSQYQLIIKSVTTTATLDELNGIIFFAGSVGNNIKLARIQFTTSSLNNSMRTTATSIPVASGSDFISIISSTDDNYLEITRDLTQQDIDVPGNISLFFRFYQYPIS